MPTRSIQTTTSRLLSLLLLLLLGACGSSSKTSDSDATVTPDTSVDSDTSTTPTFKIEEMIGSTWRVTELIADAPANSAGVINTVWSNDIRWCEETSQICCDHPAVTSGPLAMPTEDCTSTGGTVVGKDKCADSLKFIIMVKLLSLDESTLTLRVGSGDVAKLIESGSATWLTVHPNDPNTPIPPSDIDTTINGVEFTANLESAIYFVSSVVNKPIPIRKLTVNGKFVYVDDVRPVDGCRPQNSKPVPGWIMEGTLSGVITTYEAEDLVTTLIPGQQKTLKWVLDSFNDQPTDDIDDDGTLDAYKFTGTIKARMITNFNEN
ncbi:MAG: hypothetical protein KC609_17585 [Myxococcales bacterium]|nr:hypothetical protein [Myxococcales bacterium]